MKKWILLALLGILLWCLVTSREGVDETLSISATCPSGSTMNPNNHRCFSNTSVNPTRCPAGQTLDGEVCKGPDNIHSVPNCPDGTYDFTGERKCYSETTPICPTGSTLNTESGTCTSQEQSYAEQTGYADLYASVQNPNVGNLPPPTDESPSIDNSAQRPMNGSVFGSNGPFSGRAGTGQGSGMNAASTLTGSSYKHPPPIEGRLDPYDFWPGTKGTKTGKGAGFNGTLDGSTGRSAPVEGPAWGGFGSSLKSENSTVPIPADLYGPGSGNNSNSSYGFGSGYLQKNSQDTSMIPDYRTTGSDPSNVYAGTSRVPGDQDLFPPPYFQSSSYSIANGSQKTDPVPFLADFSAFQN